MQTEKILDTATVCCPLPLPVSSARSCLPPCTCFFASFRASPQSCRKWPYNSPRANLNTYRQGGVAVSSTGPFLYFSGCGKALPCDGRHAGSSRLPAHTACAYRSLLNTLFREQTSLAAPVAGIGAARSDHVLSRCLNEKWSQAVWCNVSHMLRNRAPCTALFVHRHFIFQ